MKRGHKFFGIGLIVLALTWVLVLLCVSCQTTPAGSKTGALRSLLRMASRVEVQTWDKGSQNERKVKVYSFNPEIKDRLLQAVNAEFYQIRSGEYTRDWGLPGGVLRWCVPSDTAKWDWEIHFSAAGETTIYAYQFQPIPEGGLVTWTASTSSAIGEIHTIAYGGGKFVAGGPQGSMAQSADGITWTKIPDSTFGDSDIRSIVYDGAKFVAGGNDGKFAYSNSQE